MSWMDSWSRPGKSQATPPPYYLLPDGADTPYCRSCGRAVGARKAHSAPRGQTAAAAAAAAAAATPARHCSARCRSRRPGKLDREVEAVFVRMLEGGEEAAAAGLGLPGNGGDDRRGRRDGGLAAGEQRKVTKRNARQRKTTTASKGDPRILVPCDEVEARVFGDRRNPEKTSGREKDSASRALQAANINPEVEEDDGDEEEEEEQEEDRLEDRDSGIAVDDDDDDDNYLDEGHPLNSEKVSAIDGDILARLSIRSSTRIRPPQSASEVNGSVGGEKGRAERARETEEMERRRLEGLRRAQQREMVRSAARRLVAFGTGAAGPGPDRGRKCEAVMQGKVVEPSFAKGSWGIRWRE